MSAAPGYTLPHLKLTEALLEIWGDERDNLTGGTMHILERIEKLLRGENLERGFSADTVMIILDEAVMHAPDRVRAFAFAWFRFDRPPGDNMRTPKADLVAARLGISKAGIYVERRACLESLRATLKAKGLDV